MVLNILFFSKNCLYFATKALPIYGLDWHLFHFFVHLVHLRKAVSLSGRKMHENEDFELEIKLLIIE